MYFNNVYVGGNLNAVTTTKGDVMVHNGTTNTRLPVGTNGYILKANSVTATGLEWMNVAPSQISLVTLPLSTTSTTDVQISEFTTTPAAGTYLISLVLRYSVSELDYFGHVTIKKNTSTLTTTSMSGVGPERYLSTTLLAVATMDGISDAINVYMRSSDIASMFHVTAGVLSLSM
jgi:hypothetical protein